jgi:DNA-binding LacI/PurR family transcriptional regulator
MEFKEIMMNIETKVVIAAPTFYSIFQAEMSKRLRQLFNSEEIIIRSLTDDAAVQKERMNSLLRQTKPAALIAISVRPDGETIAAYKNLKIPIILIDEETDGVSVIMTDNLMGGLLAGEHLTARGKQKIGIITGRTQIEGGYNAEQRLKGFQKALSAANLSLSPEAMIEVEHYSREEGIEIMPSLLDMGLDAVFCAAGDNCALGLLSVAKERKVRVPEDVAIIGFDDLLAARVSIPALTTIRQPMEEMTKTVYELVMNRRDEILVTPAKKVFKPELVVRAST